MKGYVLGSIVVGIFILVSIGLSEDVFAPSTFDFVDFFGDPGPEGLGPISDTVTRYQGVSVDPFSIVLSNGVTSGRLGTYVAPVVSIPIFGPLNEGDVLPFFAEVNGGNDFDGDMLVVDLFQDEEDNLHELSAIFRAENAADDILLGSFDFSSFEGTGVFRVTGGSLATEFGSGRGLATLGIEFSNQLED